MIAFIASVWSISGDSVPLRAAWRRLVLAAIVLRAAWRRLFLAAIVLYLSPSSGGSLVTAVYKLRLRVESENSLRWFVPTVDLSHIEPTIGTVLITVRCANDLGMGRKEARVRSEYAAFAMKPAIPRVNAHQKMVRINSRIALPTR